ncbi:terpene synthase-like [Leptidea sinapis]|uniref:terpene synthase-like n=1 Tax=Leptidea sinapis TaxID=189913 RepID=UPI0021C48DB3|nr:terpene synthase-like [Leptidea sinapis]
MSAKEQELELFMEKELLSPHTHILKISGKQNRKNIPMAFNYWLDIPKEKAKFISEYFYMIHTASLVLDDILDNTLVRRNVPAAHLVYGIPLTINASMHVVMLSLQKLLKLGHPMIGSTFSNCMLEAIRGQGKEIYWRDNFQCPTEEQYDHMILQKTGHMFKLLVSLMSLFSTNKTDYSHLATLLGCYFQLTDDYLNITKTEALEEWSSTDTNQASQYFYEDLTEGKFTMPIIHAAKQDGGEAVLDILRQRTTDISLKKQCVLLLEELGSLQYTKNKILQLERTIRIEIENFGGNPELSSLLDELASNI